MGFVAFPDHWHLQHALGMVFGVFPIGYVDTVDFNMDSNRFKICAPIVYNE